MTEEAAVEPGTRQSLLMSTVAVIARICITIAGVMLIAIVIINGWNVFSRYILFSALSWAEEAMVFLMIGGVFIGSIYVTWDRSHISIDALVNSLPSRPRVVMEWVGVLIASAVLWPFSWLSYGVVQKLRMFEQTSDALHMPVWIPQSMVPVTLALMPVVMALALLRANRRKGPVD